jgi:MFS family permease
VILIRLQHLTHQTVGLEESRPVTWVLISEIFPNRIRGAAVSVSVSALWIACFALTFTFPSLTAALGAAATFWLYSCICFAGFWFVLLCVSETKGRTLEEIEHQYASKVIRVDRNSRGGRRLRGREKVNAEGVRITLPEGMGLYLIYLWIECPFRLCFASMV